MKSALLLPFLVPALGFGGHATVFEPAVENASVNDCEACICENDPGQMFDESNKKCCVSEGAHPEEWDGMCDAIVLMTCKVECVAADGKPDFTKLAHFIGRDRKAGRGDLCGVHTIMDSVGDVAECEDGLYCHQPDPNDDVRICSTMADALHNFADDDEDNFMTDMTPDDPHDAQYGHASDDWLTDTEHSAMRARLADRLGVPVDELAMDMAKAENEIEDEVLRRQYYPYYYQPNHQPSYGQQPQWGQQPQNQWGQPQQSQQSPSGGTSKFPLKDCNGGAGNPACMPLSGAETTNVISSLTRSGVQLICWDWDLTAHTYHTYGNTYASQQQVNDGISQNFVSVANQWCKEGKSQAICTYSNKDTYNFVKGKRVPGTTMIATSLMAVLDGDCGSAAKFPVFGRNDHSNTNAGKTWHLKSAQGSTGNGQVMLVDDTVNNINIAKQGGYQTLFVTPAEGYAKITAQMNSQASGNGGWR